MHDRAESGLRLESEGLQPVSHVGLVLKECETILILSLCNKDQARRPTSESQTDQEHPARLRAGILHANDGVEEERPQRRSLRSDQPPGASDRTRISELLSSDERLRKSGSRSDRRLGASGGGSGGLLSSDGRLGGSGLLSERRPDQTRTAEKTGGGKWARAALLGKDVAEELAAEKELGLEATEHAAAVGRDVSMRILELSHDDDEEIVVIVPKGVRTAPGLHLDANNGMSTETLDVRQVVADVGQGMSLSESWQAIRNWEWRRRRKCRKFVETRSRDECAERFGVGWWDAQSEQSGQPTQPSQGAESEPRVPGGNCPIFRGIEPYFLKRDVIAAEERAWPCMTLGEDVIVLRAAAPAGDRHAARTPNESWHGQIFVRLNQGVGDKVLDVCFPTQKHPLLGLQPVCVCVCAVSYTHLTLPTKA